MKHEMETRMSILLAEDNRPNAEATREVLEARGWTTRWAQDGAKAWTLFRQQKPDVVIVDLEMPRMGGLELIRLIRETDERTPIVVYSGTVTEESELEAVEAGVNCVMKKTESTPLFLAKLERVYKQCCTTDGSPHIFVLSARTTYNCLSRVVRTEGMEAKLTEKEGRLMELLCKHWGGTVSMANLFHGIWKRATLGKKHALENLVSGLRKKIAKDEEVNIVRHEDGYALDSDLKDRMEFNR